MREEETDLLPSCDIILSKRKRIFRGPGATELTRHSSLL